MSGKYMKVKKIVIPTLTLILISSMLFGVSACSKKEAKNMSQQASEIEIEYAQLDTVEDKEVSALDWTELGSLTTYKDLRASWEKIVGITGKTGDKHGMFYNSMSGETQDGFLAQVVSMGEFTDFVSNEDNYNKLVDAVRDNFTDSDDLTDEQLFSIGLNAYFNLLPMKDEAETYGNDYITRAQFLALITRATSPVSVKDTDEFTENLDELDKAVGDSIYNQAVAYSLGYSYLNTDDGSLNAKTYDTAISRGEAIYTIMNMLYGEETLSTVDVDASKDEFKDTKNGGDIETAQKLKNKAKEMSYAIQNPDKGCPEQIYKALVKAKELGLIGNETSWDEAITLSDAITLYYNTAVTKYDSAIGSTNTSSTDKKDNKDDKDNKDNKSDATTSSVPESESWPEYKETMTYLLDNNLADSQYVKMLNPDIYGTETAGKATYEFSEGTCTPDIGEYVKTYDLTTTKGYKIEADWYVDTNTVQYVYTGEVSPYGGWMTDEPSLDYMDAAFNYEKSLLDITHAEKIKLLGEPSMSDEEVIAAIKVKYGM